uniref:Uncharacterized protein n=1 Tax=Timema bartmani TaxID=61472 RepID=A0A7R9F7J5_9NEOP|nr:unnamed protein product [Timema bartmani]
MEMYCISVCLKYYNKPFWDLNTKNGRCSYLLLLQRYSLTQMLKVAWCTWTVLVTWQFSQFVLTTQLVVLVFMFTLNLIDKLTLLVIVFGQIIGVILADIALFGNEMLLCSVFTCLLLCIPIFVLCLEHSFEQNFGVELSVMYNILQLCPFIVMAVLIMRLKLFLTPHLCILTSLLAARRVTEKQGAEDYKSLIRDHLLKNSIDIQRYRSQEYDGAAIKLVVEPPKKKWQQNPGVACRGQEVIMQETGYTRDGSGKKKETCKNFKELASDSRLNSFLGEYRNVELEQLLIWVNTMTTPKAVFAGPMPVMANLMLSTRRPIVNHPHYENAALSSERGRRGTPKQRKITTQEKEGWDSEKVEEQ